MCAQEWRDCGLVIEYVERQKGYVLFLPGEPDLELLQYLVEEAKAALQNEAARLMAAGARALHTLRTSPVSAESEPLRAGLDPLNRVRAQHISVAAVLHLRRLIKAVPLVLGRCVLGTC